MALPPIRQVLNSNDPETATLPAISAAQPPDPARATSAHAKTYSTQPPTGTHGRPKHIRNTAHCLSTPARAVSPSQVLLGSEVMISKFDGKDPVAPIDIFDCEYALPDSAPHLSITTSSQIEHKAPLSDASSRIASNQQEKKVRECLERGNGIRVHEKHCHPNIQLRALLKLAEINKQQLFQEQTKVVAGLAEALSEKRKEAAMKNKEAIAKKQADIGALIELLLPAAANLEDNKNAPDAFRYTLMELEYYFKLRLTVAREPLPQYL
ncbi:MAG: hypothetical protein Q9217_000199 [Psora testacea]